MRKTVTIVGNGPLPRDLSQDVDAADFVLRFNEPKTSACMSGTRTDLLMFATSSKQAWQTLSNTDFLNSDVFQQTKEVMFAFHPHIIHEFHPQPNILSRLKGRRADATMQTIEVFGGAGKPIRIMPPQFYLEGCKALGIPESKMHGLFPSTGFFGIWYILQGFSSELWDIKLCGFSWEGWKRHAWADERQWVQDKIDAGQLSMLT